MSWVNIEGLDDSQVMEDIGRSFGIHTLWLEDVLNTDHRPKLEELEDLVFCIIKAVNYNERRPKRISFEQVSLFLGQNFVISFQEFPGIVFEPVITRLIKKKGRIRESGSDYLFYAIIDSMIDDYFEVLEHLGDEIEDLEKEIFETTIKGSIGRSLAFAMSLFI